MSEASAPPAPTYSTRPIWSAAIAYLLNLAVVLALQAFLLAPTTEAEYDRGVQWGGLGGLIVGAVFWGWTTRFRNTGLAAWAAPPLAVALAVTEIADLRTTALGVLAGFLSVVGLPALNRYVVSFPAYGLPPAVRKRLTEPKYVVLCATIAADFAYLYLCRIVVHGVAPSDLDWYIALAAAVLLAVWSVFALHRAAAELFIEVLFAVPYASRARRPGPPGIPSVGPVLVVANHACWFDPVFVSKGLPRPATPMMTARFYSIWFMRPVLKYVFRVIVVPEKPIRREAPELKLAVAALDRGECVLLFPEGYLRRKEEVPLRRFGQGIWQILKDRPDTPVVACWVEGGWGAWCSYFNGPPTQNKRMDFRRRILVGVSAAETVPADLLADHLRTRIHLMNRVRAMRATLGLPELPLVELPTRSDEAEPSVDST